MALQFKKDKMLKLNKLKVTKIVMHHIAAKSMSVEDIHRIHLNQGWAGIGYHYYVRKDGHVYIGRPIEYVGSHCKGQNSISVGIALEGDFRYEQPRDAQIKSVRELIPEILKVYPMIKRVYNHKDLYPTACPVVDLKEMVTGNSKGELTDV